MSEAQGPNDQSAPRLPDGKVDVAAWMKKLGITKLPDLSKMAGGVWPEDESVDDFLEARREWRKEGSQS